MIFGSLPFGAASIAALPGMALVPMIEKPDLAGAGTATRRSSRRVRIVMRPGRPRSQREREFAALV